MARKAGRYNALTAGKEHTGHTGENIKTADVQYKTALYARLSLDTEKTSGSIESQLAIMRKFVADKPEFSECLEFSDRGISGTTFDRPDFNRMMDAVKSGAVNCIIVKDLSRLGRNYLEAGNYIETIFPFLGVRFISVNDHFDTAEENNGNRELTVSLLNLVNDMYAKDISKRSVTARRMEMERGKFVGSNAPYGYKAVKEGHNCYLVPDEPAAEIVRQIFTWSAEGMSMREICKRLTKMRVSIPGEYLKTGNLYLLPEQEEKCWYEGTIANMLKKQTYIGNLVQGKRSAKLYEGQKRYFTDSDEWIVVENTHEAIIDRELFECVQTGIKKRQEESHFRSDRGRNLPIKANKYEGMIRCGICGKPLPFISCIREGENDGLSRIYAFRCTHTFLADGFMYSQSSVYEEELDGAVYHAVQETAAADADTDMLMAKLTVAENDAMTLYAGRMKKLDKEKQTLEYEGSTAYGDYVKGIISRSRFEEMQENMNAKISDLKAEKDRLMQEKSGKKAEIKALRERIRALCRCEGTGSPNREFLESFISEIIVYPKQGMEIRLKCSAAGMETAADREKSAFYKSISDRETYRKKKYRNEKA